MTGREKLLSGAVVALLAIVAVLWNFGRGAEDLPNSTGPTDVESATSGGLDGGVDSPSETTTEVGSASPIHAAPSTGGAARYSLPPPDRSQPLASQLAALKSRAEEGDPVAACALVLDSLKCVAAATAERFVQGIEQSVAQQPTPFGDERSIDMLAHSREKLAAPRLYCEGVDPSELPRPDAAVRNALPYMSVRQKVLLTLAMHDGQIVRFPRGFGPPPNLGRTELYVMPQYVADHGYEFLRQGAEAADPLALEGLMVVHLPVWSPGVRWSPGLSMTNPRLFATYALMLREVIGVPAFGEVAEKALSRVMATMSPEEIVKVEAQVHQSLARWRASAARKSPQDHADDPQKICEG